MCPGGFFGTTFDHIVLIVPQHFRAMLDGTTESLTGDENKI